MKILFLTNLLPYPLDNGGKIKTYTTLKALSGNGHDISLVCFKENKEPTQESERQILKFCGSVNQIYLRLTTAENKVYMLKIAVLSLVSSLSFGLYKYQSKEMVTYLTSLAKNNNFDCVYFDHLPMFIYKNLIIKLWPNAKLVLDEHNCESLIMLRNADNSVNIVKRFFLKLEAIKLKKFECRALISVDHTIVLSVEDYQALYKVCNREFNHSVIPIGITDNGVKESLDYENNIINVLFVGTLTWEPNNQGLIWFLDEVVPKLEASDYKYNLYIVGKNPSDSLKMRVAKYNNITLTGYVTSLDKYYNKCQYMIVPLFIGSGQRVKILESYSYGMPTISTTIGAEGIRYVAGKDLLIADNAEEFVMQMNRMCDSEVRGKISVNCRKIFEKNYSIEAVSDRINEVFI